MDQIITLACLFHLALFTKIFKSVTFLEDLMKAPGQQTPHQYSGCYCLPLSSLESDLSLASYLTHLSDVIDLLSHESFLAMNV